jgi:hypothetical protein
MNDSAQADQLELYAARVAEMDTTREVDLERARLMVERQRANERYEAIHQALQTATSAAKAAQAKSKAETAEFLGVGDASSVLTINEKALADERRGLVSRLEVIPRALSVLETRRQELMASELRPLHVQKWGQWLTVYAELVRLSVELRAMQDHANAEAGNLLPLPVSLEKYLPGGGADYVAAELELRLGVRDSGLEKIFQAHKKKREDWHAKLEQQKASARQAAAT